MRVDEVTVGDPEELVFLKGGKVFSTSKPLLELVKGLSWEDKDGSPPPYDCFFESSV